MIIMTKILKNNFEHRVCTRCVMDSSDSLIEFDDYGVCDHCLTFDKEILPAWNMGKGREKQLSYIVNQIKKLEQARILIVF